MASIDIDAESIRLDAGKPYGELVDGIEIRKVSPQLRHARLQAELVYLLRGWATGRPGVVVAEARFWLAVDADAATSLLPDVAYVSTSRLATLSPREKQRPPFAPDLAIEIRSPGDRERNIARKIALYLERGALVVLDVDPSTPRIVVHDRTGARVVAEGEFFEHAAFPALRIDARALFAAGDPP
ncbi:MAG: Uma2 family endonuclease [Vulcanimicrobiaceae bacterium]